MGILKKEKYIKEKEEEKHKGKEPRRTEKQSKNRNIY